MINQSFSKGANVCSYISKREICPSQFPFREQNEVAEDFPEKAEKHFSKSDDGLRFR